MNRRNQIDTINHKGGEVAFVRLDVISEKGWHLGKLTTLATTISCLALFLLMNSTVARGEDGQDSSEQIDCSGGGEWKDMVYCAAQAAAREEEKLNVLINELRPTFSDAVRADFDELQQEWLRYGERRCLFERAYSGIGSGTTRQMVYWSCMGRMTVERIMGLKSMSSRLAHERDRQDSPEQIYCITTGKREETADCAAQEAAGEEERLKVLINELRPTFDDDLRAEFDEFQQEWLDYRERRCLFWERAYSGIGSGTRRQEIGFDCMRAMTEEWLSELRGLSSGATCWGICEG